MQRIALLCLLGMLPWADIHAQQKAGRTIFRVSAQVQTVCEVTAADVPFSVRTAQGGIELQITAICTPDSTYAIGLNEGRSPGATIDQRRLVSGAQVLNYQLYSDSQRRNVWGNSPGTNTVTGTGTGASEHHTIFGAVPATQFVPAGDYTDVITVRVYH